MLPLFFILKVFFFFFFFFLIYIVDLDTQIVYKLKEIDRINQEVESLRVKRVRCDEEAVNLRKRLSSCTNAIRELPSQGSPYTPHGPTTSSSPPASRNGSS